MFDKERDHMPSSEIIRIYCEDTKLRNYTKLFIIDHYAVMCKAFSHHDDDKKYPYNVSSIDSYGKNRLIETAQRTATNNQIFYLRDRDYKPSTEKNILHIDYYCIENYLVYLLLKNNIKETFLEVSKIQVLFDSFQKNDGISGKYNKDKQEFVYTYTNHIHEEYYSYVEKEITCRESFIKYIKMEKNISKILISCLPKEVKNDIKNLGKASCTSHKKIRKLIEEFETNINFFDHDSIEKLSKIDQISSLIDSL